MCYIICYIGEGPLYFPHLIKRNGRYYFRTVIPLDLQRHFQRKEIWRSLKTGRLKSAKLLAKLLAYRIERIFLLVRSGMLTAEQIRALVDGFIKDALSLDEEARAEYGQGRSQLFKGLWFDKSVIPPDSLPGRYEESAKVYEQMARDTKASLLTNNFNSVERTAEAVLTEAGITENKQSSAYVKLCRELLKAEATIYNTMAERLKGNYDNEYDKNNMYGEQSATTIKNKAQSCVKLSEVIDKHIEEATIGKNWSENTKTGNEAIYKVLLEIVGDSDVKSITHQSMLDFREKLSRLPANREKRKEFKGLPLDKVLSLPNVPPMSKGTLNKYLTRVSSLFKWAQRHGYIDTNVADCLTVPNKARKEEEREAYSAEDIANIVNALVYDNRNPQRFWIPLIGMFTGMRLNEICQLYIADVVTRDGVACIDINETGEGKRVKNVPSKRLIPVHPVLIELGLLDYVEKLRVSGKDRLWEKLRRKRDGYSQDFGKWYQRFNRTHVTKNPKRVFHSFRHTVADRLKQEGVQDTIISELLGHLVESVTMGRYGKRYRPQVLLDALQRLDYGPDIDRLRKEMQTATRHKQTERARGSRTPSPTRRKQKTP